MSTYPDIDSNMDQVDFEKALGDLRREEHLKERHLKALGGVAPVSVKDPEHAFHEYELRLARLKSLKAGIACRIRRRDNSAKAVSAKPVDPISTDIKLNLTQQAIMAKKGTPTICKK